MKYFFCLSIFLTSQFFSVAQQQIVTAKTGEHVNVVGTQVWIDAPDGFDKAANFAGLQHTASGSSMMVTAIPAKYEAIADGFTAANLKTRGMTFIAKESFQINSKAAVLISSEQFSPAHGYNFLKYSLLLDYGKDSTLLINVNFPENKKADLQDNLRTSLLSVFIDKNIVLGEFSAVDFTIDYAGTKFKPQKSMSGTLLFEGPAKSMLIIAKSVRHLDNSDKKGASIAALKAISQIRFENIISTKELQLDDAEAYQVLANITTKDRPAKALQTILFGQNYYYDFLLIMPEETPELLKDYDLILKSFKRK